MRTGQRINFLVDWMEMKQALAEERITKQEYTEWVLTWPYSASRKKEIE